jgi:hypothetical protein
VTRDTIHLYRWFAITADEILVMTLTGTGTLVPVRDQRMYLQLLVPGTSTGMPVGRFNASFVFIVIPFIVPHLLIWSLTVF